MKRLFAACLTVALAATMFVGDAEARRRGDRSRVEVIQTAPQVDPLTLMLLLGGGGQTAFAGSGLGIAPLLLPQLLSPQTVIIEDRGRRRFRRR